MEIFRISKIDMMGMQLEEYFYQTLAQAKQEYSKIIKKYKDSKELVSRDNLNHLSKPIVDSKTPVKENVVFEKMIEVWYQSSYEYNEWDTTVEHLILERIHIQNMIEG